MILAQIVSLIWLGIAQGPQNIQAQPTIPTDTLITLRRTNCFFACPDYVVTISADGTVTFQGNANVEVKGKATSQISREKVQMLILAFEKAKFFSLRNSYSEREDGCRVYDADAPSVIISITIDGKSKSINHYLGCWLKKGNATRALMKLENTIDDVANTDQWKIDE